MERRFAARRDQLLAEAEVDPRIPRGVLARLECFLDPFVELLQRSEQGGHARTYAAGLVSGLKYKNVESIAYLHDQERAPLQQFIGQSPWDHRPWFDELARQVGQELERGRRRAGPRPVGLPQERGGVGRGAAAVVRPARQDRQLPGGRLPRLRRRRRARGWSMSGSTCPRSGPATVSGGKRPGSPRGSGSARGTNWPWRCWTSAARCCRTPGWPATTRWAAAPGSASGCARGASAICRPYRPTPQCGICSPPTRRTRAGAVGRTPFVRVDHWCAGVAEGAWQTVEVRAAEKGPVQVQAVWTLVQARTEGRASDVAEVLVVFRERQGDGTWKHDYLLSNAPLATPSAEFARVFKAEHRIEECLQRAKSEAGLADYQVRTWRGGITTRPWQRRRRGS